jgi:hypothetical protein
VRPFRDLTGDDVTPWLAERFGAFFDEFRCAQGKSVFVHKYTGWSRIGFFARIFPDARFLHVIRDGRAVANSWLKMPWWDGYEGPDRWLWGPLSSEELATWEANKRSFCVLAGLGWSRLIESYELARLGVDDSRFKEIRYEDLLLDPEKVLSEALDFAGLPTNVDIARIVEQVNVGCGKRDGFHHDLGSDCMDALNSILGERLARYGYYCD